MTQASDSRLLALASQPPISHDPGVTDWEQTADGVRWAIVEYGVDAGRGGWCDTPHVGFVISGAIRYEFEDGSEPVGISAGSGFALRVSPRHRGRNVADEPTRLFMIDTEIDKATPLQ